MKEILNIKTIRFQAVLVEFRHRYQKKKEKRVGGF
jgi:hypothetical protein